MVNAKKSLSSNRLARDLDMNQKSAWYMQQRIRAARLTEESELLHCNVEADETYVGASREKRMTVMTTPQTSVDAAQKTPVLGAVERGGRVIAEVFEKTSGKDILRFLGGAVDPMSTLLMTDEYKACNATDGVYDRAVVNHKKRHADGDIHTNAIEGFWSFIRRAWYGSHHHYSRNYMPFLLQKAAGNLAIAKALIRLQRL